MFESIEFKNFKALRNATLPLGRFTLIVGANGSGKSTALNSILVLRSPGQWPFQQVLTAGVSEHEGSSLSAKWSEANAKSVVNVDWQGRPGIRGPFIEPFDQQR